MPGAFATLLLLPPPPPLLLLLLPATARTIPTPKASPSSLPSRRVFAHHDDQRHGGTPPSDMPRQRARAA